MLSIMTKETSAPNSLETRIAEAPANTTVFSDGSTFDYENGYQSNGAPVATRDRIENPKIIKSHRIVTLPLVLGIVGTIAALFLIFLCVVLGMRLSQRAENISAIKTGIDNSGQVKIVQMEENKVFVQRPDGVFKCDYSVVSNKGIPTSLVFCSPGGPATFSIPLPHDPSNVFRTLDND